MDRLQVWLLERGIATDEILKGENPIRLRNQVRGDMALENELREIRGKRILSTRLLSLTTKEKLFKAVAIADELPFEQGPPKVQDLKRGEGGARPGPANESFVLAREGAPGRAGGVRSYSFDKVSFRGMSVTDVDGDGKNEVILITPTQVIVSRFENNRMREIARFDEGAANDFQVARRRRHERRRRARVLPRLLSLERIVLHSLAVQGRKVHAPRPERQDLLSPASGPAAREGR